MLKAVIFDFDGVITDSEILHLRAFNVALKPLGFMITKKTYYTDYLGLSDTDLFEALKAQGKLGLGADQIGEMLKCKKDVFEQLAKNGDSIIDGVVSFLKILRENKIRMAICSGALLPEIKLVLERSGLDDYFEYIVSAEQVKKGKPDPEGFLLALEKLNSTESVEADQCIVIEDSNWGLSAAKKAGMHTIAVTNSYDASVLTNAEKIVSNLGALSMNDLYAFFN